LNVYGNFINIACRLTALDAVILRDIGQYNGLLAVILSEYGNAIGRSFSFALSRVLIIPFVAVQCFYKRF
jgi:hypothetical protein